MGGGDKAESPALVVRQAHHEVLIGPTVALMVSPSNLGGVARGSEMHNG